MTPSSDFASAISRARAIRRPLLAFNIVDLASLFGVALAAKEAGEPVIVQASARTVAYYGAGVLRSVMDQAKSRFGATCFLHLDHCVDAGVIQDAVDNRFDGFMIDASSLPFEANVNATANWVRIGQKAGLVVEGELGPIRGTEEGAATHTGHRPPGLEECLLFQQSTGVDLFGTDIGTAHGLYEAPPTLDFAMVEALCSRGHAGLVVHGGTGLSAAVLQRLAELGVAKINFSTSLKHAWAAAVSRSIQDETGPEPLRALQAAHAEVSKMARELLRTFTAR